MRGVLGISNALGAGSERIVLRQWFAPLKLIGGPGRNFLIRKEDAEK
jgi:hypothetical protein